jgi:hypothetical protein
VTDHTRNTPLPRGVTAAVAAHSAAAVISPAGRARYELAAALAAWAAHRRRCAQCQPGAAGRGTRACCEPGWQILKRLHAAQLTCACLALRTNPGAFPHLKPDARA